jgi:hypothetical protein
LHPIARALCFPFAAGLLTTPGASAAGDDGVEFFEKKIRPVLIGHCYKCHSVEAEQKGKLKGKLRLDLREAIRGRGESGLLAVVPGKPDESNLYRAITYLDSELVMPPKSRLAKSVVEDFKRWIEMGAPDPREGRLAKAEAKGINFDEARKFWAFRKPSEPTLPKVQAGAWPREDLDFFILAQLEANQLRPAPAAAKRTLIRRATYDLTGLPPTMEEIADFITDQSPDAFRKVVDRLLASPHYGEKWGRHWLDVARYADSNGLDENLAYVNAFRYRNYVINAFNEDKPYDQFVQEQIAGDLLKPSGEEPETARHARHIATGFLSVGAKMLAEDDGRKMEMDIIDEQLDTLGRAFMGMTLGCARCHDHKFDPIPTRDYYALAGILKSTHTMDNHKVVAQWHEIEIGTAELRAKQSEIDKAAGEQKKTIQQFKNEASKAVIEQARSNAADYLIQALIQSRSNNRIEHVLNQAKDKTEDGTPGIVLIEAETFNRGNGLRSNEGYGEGIGILISSGPTKVEYDVTVAKAGNYTLHMRYAAQQSRPGKLFANGKLINEKAVGSVTGTWYPDSQKWHLEGAFPLNAGANVLKFDWPTPTPHIDKMLFMPADAQGSGESFKTDHLHAAFSRQWTEALKQAGKNAKSPLNGWRAYLDDPIKPIDTAAIEAIRDRFAQAAEGDPLHQLLHKKDGPFKTPKEVEKLFAKADQDKLKQLQAKLGEIEKTRPATPKAMAVREGKVQDLKVHLRGDYMTQGELAPRGYLQVIANKNVAAPPKDGSGRAGFAKWLTSDNPLTARVMANRIWLWHFGQGIVRTPDNFGTLGLRPTHSELLDWLALRFVESGWSIKQMHRIIMNSAAYRMSTQFSEQDYEMDPDNKLWWRFNRRRLQAEEVRDSLLVAGDSIEWGVKGQLMTYNPRQYVSQNDHPYFFGSNRTVYLPVIRSGTFDVLQAFDFGDPAVIQGQRTSTVGAAQALFMMNHDLVAKATERLAKRVDGNPNLIAAAHQLYAGVLRREPSEREAVRSVEFVQRAVGQAEAAPAKATEQAWQSLARVLFSSNEFMFLD